MRTTVRPRRAAAALAVLLAAVVVLLPQHVGAWRPCAVLRLRTVSFHSRRSPFSLVHRELRRVVVLVDYSGHAQFNSIYMLCPNVGPVFLHPGMKHPFDVGGGNSHVVDYLGNVIAYQASGYDTAVAGLIDVEALRQLRVMNLNSNWIKDLRTEIFARGHVPRPPTFSSLMCAEVAGAARPAGHKAPRYGRQRKRLALTHAWAHRPLNLRAGARGEGFLAAKRGTAGLGAAGPGPPPTRRGCTAVAWRAERARRTRRAYLARVSRSGPNGSRERRNGSPHVQPRGGRAGAVRPALAREASAERALDLAPLHRVFGGKERDRLAAAAHAPSATRAVGEPIG